MLKVNFYDRIPDNLSKFLKFNDDGTVKPNLTDLLKLYAKVFTDFYNTIDDYHKEQLFEEYMDGTKIRLEYGINLKFQLTTPCIISEGLNYNIDFLSDVKSSAYKEKRFFKSDKTDEGFYFRTKDEIENGGLGFYVDLSSDDEYLEDDIKLFIDKYKNYGSTYEFRYV